LSQQSQAARAGKPAAGFFNRTAIGVTIAPRPPVSMGAAQNILKSPALAAGQVREDGITPSPQNHKDPELR
jgi:hypothetical protein